MFWESMLMLVGGLAAAWLSYTLAVLYGNAATLALRSRTRFETFCWHALYYTMIAFMLACLTVAATGLIRVIAGMMV